MRNFFTGTKFKIIVAILSSLVLGIFFAAVTNSGTTPLSSALSFVMTPLQNAATYISEIFSDFNGHFVSAKAYKDTVSELESEVADLRTQLVDYEKTLHKLEAYEKFLDVKEENPDFSFVPATIILRDSSDIYGSFTLNKGTSDGVEVNSPVIYSNVLVGIVKTVTTNSCTVYTLFNPQISVSAYEIRTRENCYTEPELEISREGYIKLAGITKNTPIVSGGIVCTSDIGGLYPKDLIIGTVREIRTDELNLSAYAFIEPDIDFSQINDVFIITDFEGKN